MKRLAVVGLGLAIACGGGSHDTGTGPPPMRQVQIINHLVTSVAVAVAGVPYGGATGFGASTVLTLPVSAPTLAYGVNPFQYSDGSPVPRDFVGETVSLPPGDVALHVNNVVGTQSYVAILFTNNSGVTVQPAIYSDHVQCLGILPAGGAQWYGYYVLWPTSEFRFYQNGSNCMGTYRFWTTQQMNSYEVNSGRLVFTTAIAP